MKNIDNEVKNDIMNIQEMVDYFRDYIDEKDYSTIVELVNMVYSLGHYDGYNGYEHGLHLDDIIGF